MLRTIAAGTVRLDLPGGFVLLTSRPGGRSQGDFAAPTGGGANLGDHVGDNPEAVAANRARLARLAGKDLAWMQQVHGATVACGSATTAPRADALLCGPELAPAVVVADCVPIGLLAADGSLAAAIHAGRAGLLAGVVEATIRAARRRRPEQALTAVVGPAICGSCYEVPGDMAAAAVAQLPSLACTSRRGTPALDLRAGVVSELDRLGVAVAYCDPRCTREDEELYSYRRASRTGRQALVTVVQHAG
ncbi:polyphenol oxidase family protein [Buchananella hordeovulneris]|uniref:Uncharacterized protein n=1 Tax=Buchananella hordeovulneris TaxID=52770 RepID=A0A1Q5PVJ7_9ACTO|nr:polyphenol oxidase family protein [Buchananella hordeovulneris]MDO5080593.1 polyphenol oxidase family protein [Buchananella hordeovulneris]OKL51526.1 hypothetical protein BSZ40_06675 [Buchananella hordeovulneris]RRD44087.1 laccase domain-containing protein [Buchananella hordeovulneris]RRD53648.1 laccase domain-containing protein [Buchananella hordeovulneris]